jgi:predicted hydrocarbon binding protein
LISSDKNDILDGIEFDADSGSLKFKDVRYLLVRPETVMGFFKAVFDELGAQAGELAFSGGYTGGAASTSAYKEKFNLSNEEILEYMCNMGTQLGWGRFNIEYHSEKRLEISVRNSPYAHQDAISDEDQNGSCHFIRGVLAGLGRTVLGSEVEATEPECEARGDGCCMFVIDKV